MTTQNYTLYVYKTDRRTKSGERAVSTTVWTDRDEAGMKRECTELVATYPANQGYRFEYFPTTKTVKNLMTGTEVQIDRDTPWCCNPASETFWSM